MKKILKLTTIILGLTLIFWAATTFAQGYKLEISLPSLPGTSDPGSGIAQYIQYLFVFALALAGFLALGTMMYGGIQYILAAGNAAKAEDAKTMITQALLGLGLLLVSYLLLRIINPDLVSLTNPTLKPPAIKGALNIISPTSPEGQSAGVDKACQEGTMINYNTSVLECQNGQYIVVPTSQPNISP